MTGVLVDDRTCEELTRLFNIFRIANLNVRYYGCRAARFDARERFLQLATAGLSAGALALLLASGADWSRWAAAIMAGLAASLAAVDPSLAWKDAAREMHVRREAYGHLFTLIESVITDIRRSGRITDEQYGASKTVHEAFERLDAIDEARPDNRLKDKVDQEVRKAFPPDYLWTNF